MGRFWNLFFSNLWKLGMGYLQCSEPFCVFAMASYNYCVPSANTIFSQVPLNLNPSLSAPETPYLPMF